MGDRATLQPNESVFHNGELNLLQHPKWSLQDSVGEEEEADSFFARLFSDAAKS